MGKIKKESKEKVIELMLQEVPTEEIAARLNYSIGTIRQVFEELREEYDASNKVGIAVKYLCGKVVKLNELVNEIIEIAGGCQMTTCPKSSPIDKKRPKNKKNKKNKK